MINNIEELKISENMTIKNAIVRLDETAKKILFAINDNNKLSGTVTDGDIRRWILKDGNFDSPISIIMNKEPLFLMEDNKEKAFKIMKENKIEAIPILNENEEIINIIFLNQIISNQKIYNKISAPVVIMAGGLGTRLYPYTKILPKPLIPIGDTPIIERIMNRFNKWGCENFFVTVNYKKNMIKSYFQDLEKNYTVEYIDEEKPLGTGGSLSLLKGKINETFFVSNCDILIEADYQDILKYHKEKGNKITVVSSLKNFKIPYGVFKLNKKEKIDKIEEKPEYSYLINTGMYILEPEVIKDIPENKFFNLPDILEDYLNKNVKIGVYPISEQSWMDMGQLDEMQNMINKLEVK